MFNIRRSATVCAFLMALSAPATARAQQLVRVGGLTCDAGPRAGLILGSRQDVRCVFLASGTGQQYSYSGKIRRIGLDAVSYTHLTLPTKRIV